MNSIKLPLSKYFVDYGLNILQNLGEKNKRNMHPTEAGLLSPDVQLSLALIGSIEELTERPDLAEGDG